MSVWKRNENEFAPPPPAAAPASAPAPPPVQQSAAAPVAPRPAETPAVRKVAATIGPSIAIKGDVTGEEDLIIEGRIEGKILLKANSVTIGRNGRVKANVYANSITVEGDLASRKADVNKLDAAAKVVLKLLAAPFMPLISPGQEEEARTQTPCASTIAAIQKQEKQEERSAPRRR